MAYNDEFGYHELLHTASIFASNWEQFIAGHGLMQWDKELEKEALRIGKEVYSFYQTVATRSDQIFHSKEEQ